MKAFGIWLGGFVLAFGVYAGVSHGVRRADPREVLVVVDSSFPMSEVWDQIPSRLDRLDDARYTRFALATEKRLIHSWKDRLILGAVDPFAPCNADRVDDLPQIGEADEVVVITTDDSCLDDGMPPGWHIIELE